MAEESEREHVVTYLYVRGDKVDIDTITGILGIEPTLSRRPGDRVGQQDDAQGVSSYTYRKGHWRLNIPKEMEYVLKLQEQLEHWSRFLLERADAVQTLGTLGYSIVVDCYVSEGPVLRFEIPEPLIQTFASLHVGLSFGIYGDRIA